MAKAKKTKLKKKMGKVMTEFKEGKLHSGSKKGPKVTNPKQAVAIAYSEGRKEEGKEIKHTMKKHKKEEHKKEEHKKKDKKETPKHKHKLKLKKK
jgi:hypothetical protein